MSTRLNFSTTEMSQGIRVTVDCAYGALYRAVAEMGIKVERHADSLVAEIRQFNCKSPEGTPFWVWLDEFPEIRVDHVDNCHVYFTDLNSDDSFISEPDENVTTITGDECVEMTDAMWGYDFSDYLIAGYISNVDVNDEIGDVFDRDDEELAELAELVRNDETGVTENWRVIRRDEIDNVMYKELRGDEYNIGSFNAGFLASLLGVEEPVINSMQEACAFEAIGKWVISSGKLTEFQREHVKYDGYGHHFNHCSGDEYELGKVFIFQIG